MKFADYFFAPGVKIRSVMFGITVGFMTGMLWENWQIGVLAGAVVALLTSFTYPLRAYLSDAPYEKIKNTLHRPFLLDQRVHFTVANGAVGGFFVLTESSMVFLSLERGNHRLELSREDVRRIALEGSTTLCIFMSETKFVRVISANCEEIYQILLDNQWIPEL